MENWKYVLKQFWDSYSITTNHSVGSNLAPKPCRLQKQIQSIAGVVMSLLVVRDLGYRDFDNGLFLMFEIKVSKY